jgi:long-chain acyl-CoA synthetase
MMGRIRLARSGRLTMATFVDELLAVSGDGVVSYEPSSDGPEDALPVEQRLAGLQREVAAMSRFLVEEAGVQRGDRVIIYRTNDQRCFRWFLAAIRAGAVAVPLNPMLRLAELQNIAACCEPQAVVTDRAMFESAIGSREALPVRRWIQSDEAPELAGFARFTDDWMKAPEIPPAGIGRSETVALFHTSGTEGSPKGAMLTSEAMLAGSAMALFAAPLVGRKALALFTLPWAHIMAASTAVYGLLMGARGYFLRRFEARAAIGAIARHRITVVVGVPAMFIRLLNEAPARESLESVRLWVSASDHLPDCWRRRLLQYGALLRGPGGFRLGSAFVNAYGMVETGGVAMFGLDAPFVPGDGEMCIPVPPLRVRVVDEEGLRTRPGEVGECQVRGPGVTGRYWSQAENGGARLAPGGWLRTGDLAVRNRLGLVRLAGRAKDVIKCGGYSIFVREVEEVLAGHPAVERAAVIGVPHQTKGEEPLAIVECRAEAEPGEEELLAWCRERLAAYKAPRRIRRVPSGSMPRGVTEKVLKRVLREQYAPASGAVEQSGIDLLHPPG